jgi:superfamily I DNA/RNA helicase
VSKGLEFPVVALVGVGHMPAANQSEKDEARLFYVGATRATQRLIIGLSGDGYFATRFAV